jgi:hypothetical protein
VRPNNQKLLLHQNELRLIVRIKPLNLQAKILFSLQDKDLMKTLKVSFKKSKKKLMLQAHLKEKIYMDWEEVKVMLDHTFLEDPNKLLQLINFKNTLTNQKLKSKKTLLPEFLEFHEFQKLHHKPYLWQSQKLLRIQLLKIYLKETQMEIMTKMLKQWQPQPSMFSLLLHHTKLRIFFKMNTSNF